MARRRARARALAAAGLLGIGCLALAAPAAADRGWVRGAPLNLRSGPGTQYRILGVVKPGEGLEVVEHGDAWTHVRTDAGDDGWITAGYLDPVAPPTQRLQQLESEVARLQEALDATRSEAERLRETNESLSGSDEGQRERIETLTRENYKLRAGQRWAEWIIGASILGMGMVAGAILARVGGRRSQRRLRL